MLPFPVGLKVGQMTKKLGHFLMDQVGLIHKLKCFGILNRYSINYDKWMNLKPGEGESCAESPLVWINKGSLPIPTCA